MKRSTVLLSLGLTAVVALMCAPYAVRATPAAQSRPVRGADRIVEFSGMCDASGAVELSNGRFAIADDEDNVLRVYDAARGGAPLDSIDLTGSLDLSVTQGKKKPKIPETDLEAATRIGDEAFWITSHGRNSKGKFKPERVRFFATSTPPRADPAARAIHVVGEAYDHLLADLIAEPSLARFELGRAAQLAPKAEGGLNIEGLTAMPDGGVLIGFRNPNPDRRALLVPLQNPRGVITGEKPRFAAPLLFDFGGLGVRSLSFWRGAYLIIAGPYDSGAASRLYTWKGSGTPALVKAVEFHAFNPEAFFTPDDRDEIMIISDDGELLIDGTPCKKLEDPARKRFRGAWIKLD